MNGKTSEDHAGQWIALFKEAARSLRPEQFKVWMFGVGLEGTYEERYKVGKAIFCSLIGNDLATPFIVHGLQHLRKAVNAISPDAGGAPNPRGVR